MFSQASSQHTDYQMPRTSPNYHLQHHQALLQQQLQVFHHFQAFQRHQFPSSPTAAAAAAAAAAAIAGQQQHPATDPQQHQQQQHHQHQQQQFWPTHLPAFPSSSSDSEPSLSGASAPHSPIGHNQVSIHATTINCIGDDDDDSAGQPSDHHKSHHPQQLQPLQHDNNAVQERQLQEVPSNNKRQQHQISISQSHLDKPLRAPSNKPKRVRTIFTPEQLKRLEYEFNNQMYLVGHDRCCLADSLNLSEAQVKVWFQNRRIKHRKLNPFV